jgi:hypothetical protein
MWIRAGKGVLSGCWLFKDKERSRFMDMAKDTSYYPWVVYDTRRANGGYVAVCKREYEALQVVSRSEGRYSYQLVGVDHAG